MKSNLPLLARADVGQLAHLEEKLKVQAA